MNMRKNGRNRKRNSVGIYNAPLCPVHRIAMMQLPALPDLKPGRSITYARIKRRKELNSWWRFRCPVSGCAQVAAISMESTTD
jgi:hypothetical protein